MQAKARSFRQVIEQRRRVFKEQRQPIFDAGGRNAVRYVLVDAGLRRVALEGCTEALAETSASRFIEREFARGQQTDFRHRIERALGVDIEGFDALDFIVKQVDAEGQRRSHRKQVDQAAANRILAR